MFFTSAAVLVLEILAARLLAPYVGVTLETYTGIIGTILAAIAVGTWLGGRLADRIDPRSLLGPILLLGGALSLAVTPLIRLFGALELGTGPGAVIVLAFIGFFAPAAVLSAVPPTVIKLQLKDLAETGRTVGRLSALGTAGAIFGTFSTGFVLVAALPSTPIVVTVAVALLVTGGVTTALLRRAGDAPPRRGPLVAAVALVVPAGLLGVITDRTLNRCEVESTYFCARVVADLAPCEDGLTLYLDTLRHSCVHVDDPRRLDFSYTQILSDVIATVAPDGAPLAALHVGGGGFSLPRYLEAANPGSSSMVLELDPALVAIARERFALTTSESLQVRVGDARLGIRDQPTDGFDLVVGDAFGGLAVPWHLTTIEFVTEIDRVLGDGGTYAVNLIDRPPFRFAAAEAATLRAVFDHVAVIAPAARLAGGSGGNLILVASDAPIDVDAVMTRNAARGDDDTALTRSALDAFIGDAQPLTDDYAPVDQLLAS